MAFRFHRVLKILPGVRLNFGKRGVSMRVGVRGAGMTFGAKGVRTTVGLPGTGLSWSQYRQYPKAELKQRIAALSDGQRRELLRQMREFPVEVRVDGEAVGPIAIGEVGDLIASGKLPEMTYVRDCGTEEWELIHGGVIRHAHDRRSGRLLRNISICILVAIAGRFAYLQFGNHRPEAELSPSSPSPEAARSEQLPASFPPTTAHPVVLATPAPATPARWDREAARHRAEAAEIARKYSTK